METMPLGYGHDRDLSVRRLDLDHPGGGESQCDRRDALLLKIRQGPRYARTGLSPRWHGALDLSENSGGRIPQTGDLSTMPALELTEPLERFPQPVAGFCHSLELAYLGARPLLVGGAEVCLGEPAGEWVRHEVAEVEIVLRASPP